ncbi:peroxisomal targeting signal 2 receptor [Exaiptasia diaphana]|uniref:Peroxin-7 n=1 Tax=Exaiptasia diaphana TaxID=2652724 RepID=A0A913WXU6_EXADI|nr:peroxisomal targeting signal 2 receptor [Exaiptasia diaphana]KXJ17053.1 Peroxisomal targeting signal 2 receptor [Exaiptasia diaphana]
MALVFRTRNRHGYAVKFSPYLSHRLACASSQHYGIAGRGSLYILDVTPRGIALVRQLEWNDGLFDCAWSEHNQDVIVSASGDGSLQLWNVNNPEPIKVFKGHTAEVYGVEWCPGRDGDTFLSASWDNTIKLWDPQRLECPLVSNFSGHQGVIYSALWSPHIPRTFASASGDHTLGIWDISCPDRPQHVIRAHDGEVLTCDWAKYDQNLVISGSVDTFIRGWDIRNTESPVFSFKSHQYAVRRLKCSPHHGNILASCSYDFSVRTWDLRDTSPLQTIEHHSEFVTGLDFNLHQEGQLADCSFDGLVMVYSPPSAIPRIL